MSQLTLSRSSAAALRQLSYQRHSLSIARQCLVLTAQRQQRTYATPSGPPPKGFRLQPPKRWDQEKEGTFDKVGKFFLLTEMARGMYVVLEQFFRPP
jgi:NADH dehydrogenase (ubiquinone) Fe-S protein 8